MEDPSATVSLGGLCRHQRLGFGWFRAKPRRFAWVLLPPPRARSTSRKLQREGAGCLLVFVHRPFGVGGLFFLLKVIRFSIGCLQCGWRSVWPQWFSAVAKAILGFVGLSRLRPLFPVSLQSQGWTGLGICTHFLCDLGIPRRLKGLPDRSEPVSDFYIYTCLGISSGIFSVKWNSLGIWSWWKDSWCTLRICIQNRSKANECEMGKNRIRLNPDENPSISYKIHHWFDKNEQKCLPIWILRWHYTWTSSPEPVQAFPCRWSKKNQRSSKNDKQTLQPCATYMAPMLRRLLHYKGHRKHRMTPMGSPVYMHSNIFQFRYPLNDINLSCPGAHPILFAPWCWLPKIFVPIEARWVRTEVW